MKKQYKYTSIVLQLLRSHFITEAANLFHLEVCSAQLQGLMRQAFLTSCRFPPGFSRYWDCESSYQGCQLFDQIWVDQPCLSASSPALAGAGLEGSPWEQGGGTLPLWPLSPGKTETQESHYHHINTSHHFLQFITISSSNQDVCKQEVSVQVLCGSLFTEVVL